MFVLIVGGGRTGSQLAEVLLQENHTIKLIEDRPEILERLYRELPEGVVIAGDGSDPVVLETAGVKTAKVLAAVTSEDEVNLVATSLARFEFNVPRVIARVNDPKNAWMFTTEMGVDVALNQADIFAKLIAEEMSLGDMMTLLKLRRGEFSLVEEKLRAGSKAVGVSLKDLPLPATCVIAAIIRQGKVITPRGNLPFEAGDEVLAVVDNASLKSLRELLS